MTRDEVLDLLNQYRDLEDRINRAPESQADIDMRPRLIKQIAELDTKLQKSLRLFFADYHLVGIVGHICKSCEDGVTISKVEDEGKEPQPIVTMFHELEELDRKLIRGELEYLWHIESNEFEGEDHIFQAYFAEPDLHEEWLEHLDEVYGQESEKSRYIAYELFFAAEFFQKYAKDPRLIELMSASF